MSRLINGFEKKNDQKRGSAKKVSRIQKYRSSLRLKLYLS